MRGSSPRMTFLLSQPLSELDRESSMSPPPLRLGVNVDHVATLRNARGGARPDPVRAALLAIEAGAGGLTAPLRGDPRHIRDQDIGPPQSQNPTALNFQIAATTAYPPVS